MIILTSEELILFTNRFPYFGGETFLETEIVYLSEAFKKITICPREKGKEYYGVLPPNVAVLNVEETSSLRIRDILKSYGMLICKYYLGAFIKSGHRYKYISQFRFTWNILMGYIKQAEWLKRQFQSETRSATKNTICYSYWFNEWASALAIARFKGLKGKYVVRAHGYDYDEKQNGRGYFPFREAEMQKFDNIVQISAYGAVVMKKQYPGAQNIVVSRLGVRDGGFNPGSKHGEPYRIVSCSNFVALKRIPLLIDALALLDLPYEWIHFGGGVGLSETKCYADSKLKPGSFHFAGYVKNSELMTYYRNEPVDVLINTSSLEGIPVSMMEAISCGIPIVGCDVCGVPEIVNGETGLLLPSNPLPETIAEELRKFLLKNSENTKFREGVKAFWECNFNADKCYAVFTNTLLLN